MHAVAAAAFWEILTFDQNGDNEIDPEEFVDMFIQKTIISWNQMGRGCPPLQGQNLHVVFVQLQVESPDATTAARSFCD